MVPEFKNTAALKCTIILLGSYLQAVYVNVTTHGGKWQIFTAAPVDVDFVLFIFKNSVSQMILQDFRLYFHNRSRHFDGREQQ